jgi:hypothetical protein
MERLALAAVLVVIAVGVALVLRRRRPEPPSQPRWAVPAQLDRADFEGKEAPWLVAVFSSASCESCADAISKASPLASGNVIVQEVELGSCPDLHQRYGIEAVPTTLVADREGVVRAAFVGPPSATELWAAVAEVREAD